MPRRSAIVRVGLGLLLLATAGLKLYGLGTPSAPRSGWFGQSWVQLLTAEWELVLGAWLLSGIAPRGSWLAALVTFVAFAGVSGYLATVGVASCGCLGAVKANPWWTLGADVVAVGLLVVSRPTPVVSDSDTFARSASLWASSVALTCAALVAISTLIFGSVEASVAKLRGDSLHVTPNLDIGSGKPGEWLSGRVTVQNLTTRPIRFIGGTSDCGCVTTNDMPFTLAAGGKVDLQLQLKVTSGQPGSFVRRIDVFTDCQDQSVVHVHVGGWSE